MSKTIKAKVTMLPCDEVGTLSNRIIYTTPELYPGDSNQIGLTFERRNFQSPGYRNEATQHLYLTVSVTESPLVKGDYYLCFSESNLIIHSKPQIFDGEVDPYTHLYYRKVIATTNVKTYTDLPDIPIKFVKEYCRKGGIDYIGVTYEDSGKLFFEHNNYIVLTNVKSFWTTKEVEQLCRNSAFAGVLFERDRKEKRTKLQFADWINQWVSDKLK